MVISGIKAKKLWLKVTFENNIKPMQENNKQFQYRWNISEKARNNLLESQSKFEKKTGAKISLEKIVSNILEKIKH